MVSQKPVPDTTASVLVPRPIAVWREMLAECNLVDHSPIEESASYLLHEI